MVNVVHNARMVYGVHNARMVYGLHNADPTFLALIPFTWTVWN